MNQINELIKLLKTDSNNENIPELITQVESESQINLQENSQLLKGVWELRWSSSKQPWLKQGPLLENLQVLHPEEGKAVNLLRVRGFFKSFAAIAVEAKLSIHDQKRVNVQFLRGGWLGPSIKNYWRPKLLAKVNQTYPAWLDITVLDEHIRVCRGNAGTLFCLLKRMDLAVGDWIKE